MVEFTKKKSKSKKAESESEMEIVSETEGKRNKSKKKIRDDPSSPSSSDDDGSDLSSTSDSEIRSDDSDRKKKKGKKTKRTKKAERKKSRKSKKSTSGDSSDASYESVELPSTGGYGYSHGNSKSGKGTRVNGVSTSEGIMSLINPELAGFRPKDINKFTGCQSDWSEWVVELEEEIANIEQAYGGKWSESSKLTYFKKMVRSHQPGSNKITSDEERDYHVS